MKKFLNKIKSNKNSKKVAIKVLFFVFFCFLNLNLRFDKDFKFYFLENYVNATPGASCSPYGVINQDSIIGKKYGGSACGDQEHCVNGICETRKINSYVGEKAKEYGKDLLVGILKLMGMLVQIAGKLFNVVVDPNLFNRIFVQNGGTLYNLWSFIRDLLNLTFIFILLFSAFATVFQVSKYHLKNTVLWVILMALLVNFSWPITRVIIDMSNVTMYFFIEEMLGSPSIPAKVGGLSRLSEILVPDKFEDGDFDVTYLLLAIIVVFIFAVTLLAFALILLVRVVALTILLVFSPIGFVAAAFPGSYGKYASQWWDKLFAYAMKGPIMIFMLVVALKMLEMIGTSNGVGKTSALKDIFGNKQETSFFDALAQNTAFFAIPIVILWSAIGAGSMGGDAVSGAITGKAKDWSKRGLKALPNFLARSGDFLANQTIGRALPIIPGMKKGFRPYAATRGYATGWGKSFKDKLWDEPNRQYEATRKKYETKAMGHALFDVGKMTPDSSYATRIFNEDVAKREEDLKKKAFNMSEANDMLQKANDSGNKVEAQALRNYITGLNKDKKGTKEEFARAMELFEGSLQKFGGKDDKGKLNLSDKESVKVQSDTNRLIDNLPESIYEEFANGSIELDKDGKKLVDSTKDQTEVKALENVMKSFSGNKKAEGTFRAKLRNAGGEKLLADYLISAGETSQKVSEDVMKLNAEGLGKQEGLFKAIQTANSVKEIDRTEADKTFIQIGKDIQDRFNGNASFGNEFMAKTKEPTRIAMTKAGIYPTGTTDIFAREVESNTRKLANDKVSLNDTIIELMKSNNDIATGATITDKDKIKAQANRNHVVNISNQINNSNEFAQVIDVVGKGNTKDVERLIASVPNSVIQQLSIGNNYSNVLSKISGSKESQNLLNSRMAEVNALNPVVASLEKSGKSAKEIYETIRQVNKDSLVKATDYFEKLGTETGGIFNKIADEMREDFRNNREAQKEFLRTADKNHATGIVKSLGGKPASPPIYSAVGARVSSPGVASILS